MTIRTMLRPNARSFRLAVGLAGAATMLATTAAAQTDIGSHGGSSGPLPLASSGVSPGALPSTTAPNGAPDSAPDSAYVDPNAIAPSTPRPAPREVGVVTPHRRFMLTVGGGKLLSLPRPAGSVFVADPTIADVQPPSASGVFVFGKRPGSTTLFALDHDGRPILAYNVVVEYDERALDDAIAAEAPGLNVHLARTPHGLVLTGGVPTAEAAARLQAIAERYAGPGEMVLNQLAVGGSTEVNLRVRVAEVSRSVSRQLGFNWLASINVGSFQLGINTGFNSNSLSAVTGSLNGIGSTTSPTSGNLFGSVMSSRASGSLTLDAMAEEGLVTMLAEPNLTTTSGEPATFQAGGEFPVPVPQGLGTVGIQYENYGVSVGFTPTVLNNGMISLKVKPEVSELSDQGAYTFSSGGTPVPALVTRRAETTIELASGQSFAIAGLIQNDAQNNVSKIPGLGDIPILGALFRSTQFQRNETELVIVVTAYVVHPTDTVPPLPTDYVSQPTALEQLLLGTVADRGVPPVDPEQPARLYGPAGFLFN